MIGILTPYGRNEITAAAIRLAELAVAMGEDVRLVACKKLEKNVHPFWDRRVWNGRSDGIYYAAKGCDTLVHFMVDKDLLDMTTLVADKAKQLVVPSWHHLKAGDEELLKRYNFAVCPSKTMHQWYCGAVSEKNVGWCRWDSGLPAVRREGTAADDKVKLLFVLDNNVIDFCGPMVISLAEELLDMFPKLVVSFGCTKSWCRRDRALVKAAVRRFPGRFTCQTSMNLVERVKLIHQHDWLAYPAVRADFGMTVSRAHACGVPVIVNDVPPLDELVTPKSTGLLVGCEVRTGFAHAPVAAPTFARWLEACQLAVRNNHLLFDMQQREWSVQKAQRAFNDYWAKLLT